MADLVVAAIMAALALQGAMIVVRQARTELLVRGPNLGLPKTKAPSHRPH
jgi:hypothetical protein